MDQQVTLDPSPKMIERSWLAPLVGLVAAAVAVAAMKQFDVAWNFQVGVAYLCGFIGGWVWQWMNPRDFVDRFGGWALFVSAVLLLLFLPGTSVEASTSVVALLGIPLGVVFRERGRRSDSSVQAWLGNHA